MNKCCLDCPDRRVEPGYNCHTDCPKYAEYVAENEKIKQARAEAAELANDLFEIAQNAMKRRRYVSMGRSHKK